MNDPQTLAFEAERRRLFAVAYRLLGSASEAEDAVQDAWIRFQGRAPDSPRAWLTAVVTRLCIDRLRSARARREAYVGPWLPEPVLDVDEPMDDPEQALARRETLTMAWMTALEPLGPAERAVVVLHEAFGYGFREIGAVIEKSEANCRQIHRRARARLADRAAGAPPAAEDAQRLLGLFLIAAATGDLAPLEHVLRDDVVMTSDGGGKVTAARVPVVGRDRVLKFVNGLRKFLTAESRVTTETVNGEPAVLLWEGTRLVSVMVFEVVHGAVVAIRSVLAPDKLAWIQAHLSAAGSRP